MHVFVSIVCVFAWVGAGIRVCVGVISVKSIISRADRYTQMPGIVVSI